MFSAVDDLRGTRSKIHMSPYTQTTSYTCVASSYLMCLNHFFPKVFPLTKETEMEIHDKIKFWEGGEGEYGSYPKLARHALNLGLEVNIGLEGPRKPEFISDVIWSRYMENYLHLIIPLEEHPRFKITRGDFTVLSLLNELEKGFIPIVEIKYPSSECTHHVVLTGHNWKEIRTLDPLSGPKRYDFSNFKDKINLGYMKNFISLRKSPDARLELIAQGLAASKGEVIGTAQVVQGYDPDFTAGNILISPRTDPDMVPNMIISSGLITDQGGILCHAAIVAREFGLPAIVGTREATHKIKDGDQLYLDGDSGKVYCLSKNEESL